MNNLEDLVPNFELCNKIPNGYFEDSVFGWKYTQNYVTGISEWEIVFRGVDNVDCPAPTLQEIFVELAEGDKIVESFNPLLFWNDFLGGWILECRGKLKQKDGVIDRDELSCRDRKNPATASLKLWLELNPSEVKP